MAPGLQLGAPLAPVLGGTPRAGPTAARAHSRRGCPRPSGGAHPLRACSRHLPATGAGGPSALARDAPGVLAQNGPPESLPPAPCLPGCCHPLDRHSDLSYLIKLSIALCRWLTLLERTQPGWHAPTRSRRVRQDPTLNRIIQVFPVLRLAVTGADGCRLPIGWGLRAWPTQAPLTSSSPRCLMLAPGSPRPRCMPGTTRHTSTVPSTPGGQLGGPRRFSSYRGILAPQVQNPHSSGVGPVRAPGQGVDLDVGLGDHSPP
jgi:hypothetical protein